MAAFALRNIRGVWIDPGSVVSVHLEQHGRAPDVAVITLDNGVQHSIPLHRDDMGMIRDRITVEGVADLLRGSVA